MPRHLAPPLLGAIAAKAAAKLLLKGCQALDRRSAGKWVSFLRDIEQDFDFYLAVVQVGRTRGAPLPFSTKTSRLPTEACSAQGAGIE